MNTSNEVSADGADDLTGKEYYCVTLDTDGIELAASGDPVIGTLLRGQVHREDGVYAGQPVAVQLRHSGIHYAVLGATTAAVAKGAGLILDSSNPGQLVPSESSPLCRAWEAFTGANGGVVRVYFL